MYVLTHWPLEEITVILINIMVFKYIFMMNDAYQWHLHKNYTVGCHIVVQHIMILHTALQWQ